MPKNDISPTSFFERGLEFSSKPERSWGVTQIVMPQNWLFLTRYEPLREAVY